MITILLACSGVKWKNANISWGIEKDSQKLGRQDVIQAATAAFGKWSAETPLQFNGPVDQV